MALSQIKFKKDNRSAINNDHKNKSYTVFPYHLLGKILTNNKNDSCYKEKKCLIKCLSMPATKRKLALLSLKKEELKNLI